MRRSFSCLFFALLALVIWGCGSKSVVGKYAMDIDLPAGSEDSAMAHTMAATLELREDKTFNGLGAAGTYAVKGDIVELRYSVGGPSMVPLKFKIVDGGNALEPVDKMPPVAGGKAVRFVRQ